MRAVRTILRRPLTRACWRETLYLLIGLLTGIVGFTFIVTGVSMAMGLIILVVGLPLVAIAHLDRGGAGSSGGSPSSSCTIRSPPTTGSRPDSEGVAVVLGPRRCQTWLDVLWMFISLPLGVVGFTVAVSAWTTVGALLTFPIFGWSIPGWLHTHVVFNSIVAPFLSVPAAIAAAWLVRGLALGIASIASAMLGPNRRQVLESRCRRCPRPAPAPSTRPPELQRVERDLHDGAQARLVALSMDLGLAEQRLARPTPTPRSSTSPTPAARPAPRWPNCAISCAGSARASSRTAASTRP